MKISKYYRVVILFTIRRLSFSRRFAYDVRKMGKKILIQKNISILVLGPLKALGEYILTLFSLLSPLGTYYSAYSTIIVHTKYDLHKSENDSSSRITVVYSYCFAFVTVIVSHACHIDRHRRGFVIFACRKITI